MAGSVLTFTGLRAAETVAEQPRLPIHHWRVMRLANDAIVLVGVLGGGHTIRLTTPIVSVFADRREMRTSSGRIYELAGPPAHDRMMLMALEARIAISGIGIDEDVTERYWRSVQSAGIAQDATDASA